ncbi:MAG: phosphate ABC transporter permease PstA [Clostridiaceae bacterium]|nr:phosphate ABC transporter permease PstA [Clostridiaceae bacterium]
MTAADQHALRRERALRKRLEWRILLKHPASLLMRLAAYTAAFLTVGVLLYLLVHNIVRGIPHLNGNLFAWKYSSENLSLVPALINTLIMTALALLLAVPIGVGAAIYLVEYSQQTSKIIRVIRLTTETLAGIPSIVYGLFGSLFFVRFLGWGMSLIAGTCTMAIVILPLVIRSTEEALLAVPDAWREASYALGAGKLRTVFTVVLPAAIPGILAGIILATGRIVGESAAVMYTAGSVAEIPSGRNFFRDPVRTLAVHMYILSSEGLHPGSSYATGLVLMVMVLILNTLSRYFAKRLRTKAGQKDANE